MARQGVDIGVEGNDGTGDSIRESFRKVNENFQELYAVFGIGGQISFTDLSDTPNSYVGNENKVPLVRSDGSGLNLLELASDNALSGTTDTIGFDFSIDGKVIIRQLVSKVSNDPQPTLSGPLDAATQPIAGVSVSQAAIDSFNSVHGTDLELGALVINKNYADRNYQEKAVAGGGFRVGSEPADKSSYSITADSITSGYFVKNSHGLSQAFAGAPFVFNSTGDDPFGVVSGNLYYIDIADDNNLGLYSNESDAINGTGRILLSGGTGTFELTDSALDNNLEGNWLSNVALPRKSITRREGDTMTGALNLFDHPGELVGTGLPFGPDDLQAASKLYVDNAAKPSTVNLYVSTAGTDAQPFTPVGKEGRSAAYAYRTINAAARKAEEIILASPFEPGPYMQTMTFNAGANEGLIDTAGITSPISGRSNARAIIVANKEFIAKEVTGYIDATFPEFADQYNKERCQLDVTLMLDSVSLDSLLGNNANYLSRYSGLRYYSSVSAQKAIGSQKSYTVAGIEYAKLLVTTYILTNTAVPTTYQSRVPQVTDLTLPDTLADNAIGAKFDVILDVINNGPLDAPGIVDGQTTYKINIGNGNFGFIDQANPTNTDIIPGKVVRGKNSGAIGRIIDYKHESGSRPVSTVETDEIEVQLLEPFEFQSGEPLEYGNIVNDTQISIRIESGIYEEDLPIRVPANVSVKGDEFRRVIVRPKDRVSQSRYANTFFYRDAEFDGLILGKSSIETINFTASADALRTAGTYTITQVDYATSKLGKDAKFDITVDNTGAVTDVTVITAGDSFQANEIVTVQDSALGNNGAAPYSFTVLTVPNGIQYTNPLTNQVEGYFGNHYLLKPNKLRNIGAGYENIGNWETAALSLIDNKEFIQEQVVNYVETTYPALIGSVGYSRTKCFRDAGLVVEAMVKDYRAGGNEFSLEAQGEYYSGAVEVGTEVETVDGLRHIYTLANDIVRGISPATLYGPSGAAPDPNANLTYAFDDFNGDGDPESWSSGNLYRLGNVVKFFVGGEDRYYTPTAEHTSGATFDATEILQFWRQVDGIQLIAYNLIETVVFAFNAEYNPPLRNDEMDVFLMNDATILRNITGQGHGGFQMVLDPEGQVLTKSPYCQTGTGFAKSDNKQVFRGGLFVDAFVGNSAVRVTSRVDGDAFKLDIQSLGSQAEPQGLFVRRPETPSVFYIDGRRFQINAVTNYDKELGTATLILSPGSNSGLGFSGLTSSLATGVDLSDLSTPIPITIQTAGNRSMLGNDFTQINDKGYGLVAVNGALSEMVSMFTYYCHTSYYAKNGSEIRSLTGSSCYGEYGLVAEGSDPNEIPDAIQLAQDMMESAKTFHADVILELTGPVILQEGDQLTQSATNATGVVSSNTSQLGDSVVSPTGERVIYLTDTSGAFDTTNQISITGPITGDSVVTPLGANSVPLRVDTQGYGSNKNGLFIFAYDFKENPSNRSEFDVYHPTENIFARYEVANASPTGAHVGRMKNIGTEVPFDSITIDNVTAAGALFNFYKTIKYGYTIEIVNGGTNYTVGDSMVVSGANLGGGTTDNDAFITILEVNSGVITKAAITGSPFVDSHTPMYDGRVRKLNFSTSDNQFSTDGLIEDVPFGTLLQYRRNQTHIISDFARPDVLTIRPSTAVIFDENPNFVYRSISFLTSDSLGNELENNELQSGFDSSYDYIRMLIESAKAQETALSNTGTTKGGTAGDTVLALQPVLDDNEIFRLNNNARTDVANRPIGATAESLTEAPIFVWQGKKHFVFNARGVNDADTIVPIAEDNEYVIVDILAIDSINLEDFTEPGDDTTLSTGLASPVVLGSNVVTIRAGLQAGATGTVTVNISTCRATSHDFLDVGSGGFNESNYPTVIFGEPGEKDQSKEVDERTKGRVFYVSTDQNGIFRVGKFFSVDQGTGTVTFSASLALSDVDGIGFKRGVVVTEFSTDTAMTDNAADTVPTELAVRGYVNRRLGYDVNGAPVANKLGPGVLAPNGAVPMTDDLNAAGNTITNIKLPDSDSDAATKAYVDDGRGLGDEIKDLRSLQYQSHAPNQLLVSTEYKKLLVLGSTVVNGPFARGDIFTGSISGATGQIIDVQDVDGYEGNLVEITYTPTAGIFSDGKPAGASPDADVLLVSGGAEGRVVDGPVDEWVNGVASAASDIEILTSKVVTEVGGVVTERYTELNLQMKPNTIVNDDVQGTANISQSKLNLNEAATRADATGITQNDLGVASFDSALFTSTSGFVSISNGQIPLEKIQRINDGTVLGNYEGDSSDNDIDQIPFSRVIQEGGGLADADFISLISSVSDAGQALIRTGEGTYGISNVTISGEVNSIVKTDASGSVQANSLILGGDSSYEVLSLDGTTVILKTPSQGELLRAAGGAAAIGNPGDPGYVAPTFPTLEIAGSVNISSTGVTESTLQGLSNFNGEKALGVDWIYSSFIEAPGEKGAASTAIAIGANTGKSLVGQVAIVTADSATNSSVVPALFSSSGMLPDTTNSYDIGSASRKYANVYATTFRGTATEAYYADLAENYTADANYEASTVVVFGGDAEVTLSTQKLDPRVAGVVSTNPAYLMNSHQEGENVVAVALQGRVPCKVIGQVQKGDLLVTSAIPGYAIVATIPQLGTVIGKALENKEDLGKGTVEVVVGRV